LSETPESDPQRERLLDAAEACLARYGLGKTTIEDVARLAGLSRATVYRQFGTRDALVAAVAAREAERCAADALAYLTRFDDIASWIVEGVLFCLREIPKRPVLAQLGAPQDLAAANRLVLSSERMLAIGSDLLRPMFERARREEVLAPSVELDTFIEWVLRILMSFLAVPGPAGRDEAALRRILRTMLLPAVLHEAARGAGGTRRRTRRGERRA
jgi:AcrR family transcriptional regulator